MRPVAPALLLALAACASPPPRPLVAVSDGRQVMGTVLEITLEAEDGEEAWVVLQDLFVVAAELDALLTVYDEESALSRLNRAAGRGPRRVHPDLADVLERARGYSRLTRGSFDVTIGPLVDLWTEAARSNELPSEEALRAARSRVGSEYVRVYGDGRAELTREGVSVNLGGIAKGYALDRMLPLLRENGIDNALLNFGQSSIWALGAPPGNDGWRLLARGAGTDLLGVLTLRDLALSISGSLGQYVEIGGRRYGHILDPRSGEPLTRKRMAFVVAPNATLAEALSKALLVLGEDEGIALVDDQKGCEALLLDASGAMWQTPGWAEAVHYEPLETGSAGPRAR